MSRRVRYPRTKPAQLAFIVRRRTLFKRIDAQVSIERCTAHIAKTVHIQIFDGAAATWRKVLVESVAVRWVDLGTRLVLRHVVRVLGAEVRGKSPIIMAVNEHTKVADGEHESGESGRRSDAARDCDIGLHADHTIETNGSSGKDADGGVGDATVEIDLCETRWGECTGGERRQSEAKAERFVGMIIRGKNTLYRHLRHYVWFNDFRSPRRKLLWSWVTA